MKLAVIIPAAGIGKRFKASGPTGDDRRAKIEIDLCGRPVLMRSVELFVNRTEVQQIIVAVDPDHIIEFRFRWGDKLTLRGVQIVSGGKTERWQTVLKALDVVGKNCTHVAVHDAVRPLASRELIDRVLGAAMQFHAVIPAVPVHATLKRVLAIQSGRSKKVDPLDAIMGTEITYATSVKQIVETVSRSNLVLAQTPQVFELALYRRAYAQIAEGKLDLNHVTDDASLIEALGELVHVVEGESTNLKITQIQDVELARAVLVGRNERDRANPVPRKFILNEED